MSYANPRYDPSRRRRGRHRRAPAAQHSPLAHIVTTAAVAYGAYRLGSWAWNAYVADDGDKDEEGDFLYEDYRAVERDVRREEGFADVGAESPDRLRRSRRSRVDWDDGHDRSSSPSPPQDYHHHSPMRDGEKEPGGGGEGLVKRGVKKAASAAASGLGSAVSAGISAGIHAFNESSSRPAAQEQERQLRMGRCRLEASRAMLDFLPTLKKAVAKETDVSSETEGLKRLRVRKREMTEMKQRGEDGNAEANDITVEEVTDEEEIIREEERRLWNDIKIKSVARLVTTAYAHTIVFLVLTVQVNLLGGQLLREEQEEKDVYNGADRYRNSHQTVLAKTYRYLFANGIPTLAQSVTECVEEALQKWDVFGDEVTQNDVTSWIESVRNNMERRQQKNGGLSPFVQFVIPPEGEASEMEGSADTSDELAKYILDETYDLLESPTFATAERQCLDATFDLLQQRVTGKLFLSNDRIPLANVVTHLQKAGVSTFHKPPSHKEEMQGWGGVLGMMEEPLPSVPNAYISKLERLGGVAELGDVCF
ncbi:hypothetical protein ACHAXT_008813 [Thalassiosira profunda]